MTVVDICQLYFDLSNKSDLASIGELFTNTTKYISPTTGEYVGRTDIMKMQTAFHHKFSSLRWDVNSIKEIRPGLVVFDYDFIGELRGGEKVESSGLEYITIEHDKISKVEIRNKP